ncbi:hypothetical protein [Pelagerythrobacter rhizovicinus]|uniref:Uncharacterized protein n=1 Tax=Pelagerythrobacter rhizovicinus TaxID=2268576 RepID=A0A4Q2KNY5_9SPHN|nr:hypothetical protein [Pelagerythrobacter rhizovicinus]RXZ65282.1 hypothetical protein ETX26_00515 [Pelagerythrobacter rhizovicinus]
MADALETARKFLESLQRFELATLLDECSIAIVDTVGGREIDEEWFPRVHEEVTRIIAPTPIDEALRKLPDYDRKRVADAIANGYGSDRSFDDLDVQTVKHEVAGVAALIAELIIHREMMIDVATGGQRIQEVNDYYRAREVRIRDRIPADVKYENPHEDLWAWYHHWSENLPQYKDRRHYARQLFGPAIEALAKRTTMPLPERAASGWERVDRALSKARAQLGLASAEEDFQGIGLLCREVIISLAQAVFDPELHKTTDGIEASNTDANRMIEAYIAHEFPGASFKEVRAHARASLALALNLQHRRTATRQLAALCLEGTASTVAVISIIARPSE